MIFEKDLINYLMNRKYPSYRFIQASQVNVGSSVAKVLCEAHHLNIIKNAEAYIKHLESLPLQDLIKLVEGEKSNEEQEAQIEFEKRVKQLPHNQSSGKADYSYWGKIPLIDVLEEGVPLLQGLEPKTTKLENMKKYSSVCPVAYKFVKNYFLCSRLLEANELKEKETPAAFIQTIKTLKIEISHELEQSFRKIEAIYNPKELQKNVKLLTPEAIQVAKKSPNNVNKDTFAVYIFKLGVEKGFWKRNDFNSSTIERELSKKSEWSKNIRPKILESLKPLR